MRLSFDQHNSQMTLEPRFQPVLETCDCHRSTALAAQQTEWKDQTQELDERLGSLEMDLWFNKNYIFQSGNKLLLLTQLPGFSGCSKFMIIIFIHLQFSQVWSDYTPFPPMHDVCAYIPIYHNHKQAGHIYCRHTKHTCVYVHAGMIVYIQCLYKPLEDIQNNGSWRVNL